MTLGCMNWTSVVYDKISSVMGFFSLGALPEGRFWTYWQIWCVLDLLLWAIWIQIEGLSQDIWCGVIGGIHWTGNAGWIIRSWGARHGRKDGWKQIIRHGLCKCVRACRFWSLTPYRCGNVMVFKVQTYYVILNLRNEICIGKPCFIHTEWVAHWYRRIYG